MNALAALTALVLVLVGSSLVTKTPGASPIAASVVATDTADDMPPYIHVALDEWR